MKKSQRIVLFSIVLLLVMLFCNIKVRAEGVINAGVSYSTHIQNIGWQDYVQNGNMSGTSGKGLRLEAIKIKLNDKDYSGDILYSTHVQNIGWQNYVKSGELSGTSGKGYRLEAVKVKLTGEIERHYDVYYRVHAQNFGWMDWAKNGEEAGTEGYGFRLEAIEIELVSKGNSPPIRNGSYYSKAFAAKHSKTSITYSTHIQNIGWQDYRTNGVMSGTSGKGLRLEAIKIKLENSDYPGEIVYSTHIQDIGWDYYSLDDGVSGTLGKGLRLEAIKIRLQGLIEKFYDVYYRVHAQNFGWMGWAKNDEEAGTSGYGYRLEAIEIVLVKKGGVPPSKTSAYNKPFSDITEKFERQEQSLISKIDGYYWYLDGYDYSYIKFEKKEWYNHYMLDVDTFGLRYIDDKIIVDEKNWEWGSSSELHNMLMKNPIDLGYQLTRDYKMYIKDEKLYITINNIEYCFNKDEEDKSKIVKPYFLGDKYIEITTDEDLYRLYYDISPFFTSCNTDIKISPSPNEYIEWTWNRDKKELLIHPVKPGNLSIMIQNPDNEQGDAVTINIKAGSKTKAEKIYCRGEYISNFVNGFITTKSELSRWDNLATSQNSSNYYWLSVEVYPYTSINKKKIFSSSDTSIVEVTTDGKYITKKPGEAIITIQLEDDESVKNEIKIIVRKRNIEAQLNVWNSSGEMCMSLKARYGSYDYSREIEIYREGEFIEKRLLGADIYGVSLRMGEIPNGNYKIVGKVTDSDGDVSIVEKEIEYKR